MTLAEFFNNDRELALHCKTKEQAEIFAKQAHKLKRRWHDKQLYIQDDKWNFYCEETCYDNNGFFADCEYYSDEGIEIIDFDEITFTNDEKKNKTITNRKKLAAVLETVLDRHFSCSDLVDDDMPSFICHDKDELLEDIVNTLSRIGITLKKGA